MKHYDVLVAGGGTAGAIAAIQAGRLGASVLLIEMTGQLGGTMTNGQVSSAAYFWSPLKQIIAGIGWELVQKAVALGSTPPPDYTKRNPLRPSYHTGINRFLWALLTEEECLKAGVDIHYHEVVTEIHDTGDGAWELQTAGKNTRGHYQVKEIIDCTGDANIVQMLGYPVVQEKDRQPATLVFHIGGIDFDAIDENELQCAYEEAMATGELQPGDFCYTDRPFINFLKSGGSNQQHIFDCDTATSEAQTQTSIRGRQSLLRLLRFIRRQKGCEKATVDSLASMACARDTWRIVGEHTITYDEYMAATVFPDAVCNTLYFIDVHNENGTHHEFLPPENVPTLPFSSMIPKGSRRLLVAGRTVSSDKRAHSALRIECTCMAMGQAAAVAAALGVKKGIASRDVPIDDIRAELQRNGAILPPQ